MQDVEFEEKEASLAVAERTPPLIGVLVRTKVAKDRRSAEHILVAFSVVIFCISLFLFSIIERRPMPPEGENDSMPLLIK